MSKEKKFHNLIEQGGKEEKERLWKNIHQKDAENIQNEPTMVEMKPKKLGFLFTRKFAAWSSAIALALIFAAVGFTQFLLKGQIERPGGNADLEAQPNYSDNQQEEISPDVSMPEFGETSTDDFIGDSGNSGDNDESGNQGAVGEGGSQGESGEQGDGVIDGDNNFQEPTIGNYYTSADYTERELSQTLQEYAPNLLCFERLYENTCLTFVYESKTNQSLVYVKESYPAPDLLGSVTLNVASQNVMVEDLLPYENHPNAKTKKISGVTVQYDITTAENGARVGYAFFLYNGYKYYVNVTEDTEQTTLTEAYLLSLIQELLS